MTRGVKGTATISHGTTYGYKEFRCRCDPCKAAEAASKRQYRAAKRARTGQGIRNLTHRGPEIAAVAPEQRAIFNALHLADRVLLVSSTYPDTPVRIGEEGIVVKKGWTEGWRFLDVLWDRGFLFFVSPDAGDVIERVAA